MDIPVDKQACKPLAFLNHAICCIQFVAYISIIREKKMLHLISFVYVLSLTVFNSQ